MTKGELVKLLDKYDDNAKVVFTLECDDSYRDIDVVRHNIRSNFIALESKAIPNEDDMFSIITAILSQPKNGFSSKNEKLLEEFIK